MGAMNEVATPTRDDTVDGMLTRAKRARTPVRRVFVQRGRPGGQVQPGLLATFVTNGDEAGLDLLLLVLALASSRPFDVRLHSAVWARALGLAKPDKSGPAISKIFKRLRDRKLVTTTREKRLASITPLLEDGSGDPYTRPGADGNRDAYLQIPAAFWTDSQRWYRKLSLAAKAVLLIGLSQRQPFALPVERASAWYGVSQETATKGLAELQEHGLLTCHSTYRLAPLTPAGVIELRHYTLAGPFKKPGKDTAKKATAHKRSTAKKSAAKKSATKKSATRKSATTSPRTPARSRSGNPAAPASSTATATTTGSARRRDGKKSTTRKTGLRTATAAGRRSSHERRKAE